MSIFTEGIDKLLNDLLSAVTATVTTPRPTKFGGAKLLRFSQKYPKGEMLGLVLAGPNVPREYHSGFDPKDPKSLAIGNDFIDRVIYITEVDYQANQGNRDAADIVSSAGAILRRKMDADASCGCSCASLGTPVYRMTFGREVAFEALPEEYAVLTAKFATSAGDGMITPMTVTEYWIATQANRNMILDTQEFKDAFALHVKNRPLDCDGRRERVLAQVNRLKGVTPSQVLDPHQ